MLAHCYPAGLCAQPASMAHLPLRCPEPHRLPRTIALSDGEEPPPTRPCTLQLRDPEQQMELNRETLCCPLVFLISLLSPSGTNRTLHMF
ncbi:unnamed protein product [Gadus morhua 'NCC']